MKPEDVENLKTRLQALQAALEQAQTPPEPLGIKASLHALGAVLWETAHDRLELVSIELQEERYRLVETMVGIGVAVSLGMLTALFVSITLVCIFWDSARLTVLCSVSGLYLLAFLGTLAWFYRRQRQGTRPLAETLETLKEDKACIQAHN